MMQVTGEEGITLEDFMTYQKSRLVDTVYLQQDAYDPVDVSVPMARQLVLFELLEAIISMAPALTDKAEIRHHYLQLTGLLKNLNYSPHPSQEYQQLHARILDLAQLKSAG